jgi:hypothetical protein
VAKSVAAMLNKQPIGGKHRSAYRFDLWCLKYLPKFRVCVGGGGLVLGAPEPGQA